MEQNQEAEKMKKKQGTAKTKIWEDFRPVYLSIPIQRKKSKKKSDAGKRNKMPQRLNDW